MRRMEAIRLDGAAAAWGMTSIRRAALGRPRPILFPAALLPPTAASGAVVPANIHLGLTSVVTGLSEPLLVTHAGGGSGRLFVVAETGKIRIVQDGGLGAAPLRTP